MDAAELEKDNQVSDKSSTADALEQSLKASQKRITTLNEELSNAYRKIESLRSEKDTLIQKVRNLTDKVQALSLEKEQLERENQREKDDSSKLQRYQSQINQLTNQVSTKQSKIDSLSSELSVLHVQLQREIKARENLEAAGGTGTEEFAGGDDVESASGRLRLRHGHNSLGWSQGKPYSLGSRVPLSNLKSISRYRRVARFADIIDKCFGEAAYLLAVNPVVRLVFLAYLFLLHLMCFFILAFHTHELNHEDEMAANIKTNFPAGD